MSRDIAFGKTTQEGVVEARRPAKCVPVLSVHSVGVLTWTSVVSANCLPSLRHLMPVLRASCLRRWWIFMLPAEVYSVSYFCFYPRLTVAQVPLCLWDSKAFREPGYISCVSLGCIHGFSLHSPGWPVLKILSLPGSEITGVWPLA